MNAAGLAQGFKNRARSSIPESHSTTASYAVRNESQHEPSLGRLWHNHSARASVLHFSALPVSISFGLP